MIVVDSSAVVAIVLGEQDAAAYATAIRTSGGASMAGVNWLESAMVVDRKGDATATALFDSLAARYRIDVVPFTREHATIARDAWRRYGKGSGHPAQLNFGDCMAYALARHRGEMLLYKGDDFSRTDIASALPV